MPPSVINEAKRKARMLENFDYRKRVKSSSDEQDESGNNESSETIAAAMECLHKFRKMPVGGMDEDEMKSQLLPLLQQYLAKA